MTQSIFLLGGAQTDFELNAARHGMGLFELMREAVNNTLECAGIAAAQVQAGHVGNFVGELFSGQGHLGGMFEAIDSGFRFMPASRHEAACASGSIALLAATAEIEAGRYDCVLVTGVELERNVAGAVAAKYLAAATWVGQEAQDVTYAWPHLFNRIGEEYEQRYGLQYEHLARIAQINIENARSNPNAQTRNWQFTEKSFLKDDEANPVIEGMIRRQDCGQVTDGAAAVILASPRFAAEWARRHSRSLSQIPRITGWGHTTSHLKLEEKLRSSAKEAYVFPHVRKAIKEAFRRSGVADVFDVDGIEIHDCFTTTEYMAIDHFGITLPGESWKAIESGVIERNGKIPINPSGGLIGAGHPVGATGVRMVLDASRQVSGTADGTQVIGARRFATLNIGGSATTVVSFIIEVESLCS